jgi:hypothetical protein
MQAFINEVSGLAGKQLTVNQAQLLTTSANEIKRLLACP